MAAGLGLHLNHNIRDTIVLLPVSSSGAVNSVNEGFSINFKVLTTRYVTPNPPPVPLSESHPFNWSIESTQTTASDLSPVSGSFYLENIGSYNVGSFTITANADFFTESVESFRVAIIDVDDSASNVIAYSPNITINDTSKTIESAEFTVPGTYAWICPPNINNVAVLCIGGGGGGARGFGGGYGSAGGGGGGGLSSLNYVRVTPGQSYLVIVGAGGAGGASPGSHGSSGTPSYFVNTNLVYAGPGRGGNYDQRPDSGIGATGGAGGTWNARNPINNDTGIGGVGGRGGSGAVGDPNVTGGGGGAAGYTGSGGNGGSGNIVFGSRAFPARGESSYFGSPASLYFSGGGGGGSTGSRTTLSTVVGAGSGGGVGIFGKGPGGVETPTPPDWSTQPASTTTSYGGNGGSNGGNGVSVTITNASPNVTNGGAAGLYGGGGGGAISAGQPANGAGGAVRIVWRAGATWPSTNVY
jgi:hypothetical protein